MVNSSWTRNHIQRLLMPMSHRDDADLERLLEPLDVNVSTPLEKMESSLAKVLKKTGQKQAHIVYPSCDTKALTQLKLQGRAPIILSLAQFRYVVLRTVWNDSINNESRPEKEHAKQLRILRELLDIYPEHASGSGAVTLIMAGSVRNTEDEIRVAQLKELAAELRLSVRSHFEGEPCGSVTMIYRIEWNSASTNLTLPCCNSLRAP